MKNEDSQEKLRRLRTLSELMDSKFEGPFGIRFGLDGILGFVPFIGDIVSSLVSFSILVSAAQMGASPATLIRMSLNIFLENLIDMVPFLGSVFDFWFQANNRNMRILEEHIQDPERASVTSRVVILTLFAVLMLILFSFIYLSWMMLQVLIGIFS